MLKKFHVSPDGFAPPLAPPSTTTTKNETEQWLDLTTGVGDIGVGL
jgi:hypothetical protein